MEDCTCGTCQENTEMVEKLKKMSQDELEDLMHLIACQFLETGQRLRYYTEPR